MDIKKILIITAIFLMAIIGFNYYSSAQTKESRAVQVAEAEIVAEPEEVAMVAEPEPEPVIEPEVIAEDNGMTNQQRNAVRSAENYISILGFSREGLIDQLSSEAGDGYSIDDATIAVNSLDIDYDEQAGRSAENYLSFTGFSCDGLVEQLSSSAGDKYTTEQAEYGAILAGACD